MKTATIHTDGGATKDEEVGYFSGYGVHIEIHDDDTPERLFYSACTHGDTNNRAEQQGLVKAIETVLDEKIEEVTFVIDSKYVIEGFLSFVNGWKKNGWITSKGTPVLNKDLWILLDDLKSKMLNAGVKFNLKWVKGHSGHHGNELADKGATMGTALARCNDFEPRCVECNPKNEEVEIAPGKKQKKPKAKKIAEPFALLCGRRMLEMVNSSPLTVHGNRAYMTVSYDDTDPIKARGLGVMAGERFEGLVVPNEPEEIYENIVAYQNEITLDSLMKPVIFYWDKIKSSKVWKEIGTTGNANFLTKKNSLLLKDGSSPISFYLDPPRQARRALQEMAKKKALLENQEGEVFEKPIDVTDLFYSTDDKGKVKLRDGLNKAKSVTYKIKDGKRTANLIMSFDFEIPGHTAFNKLIKQAEDVKCSLLITERTKNTFRWSLLVESSKGFGLFNNPSTNLYILAH